MARDDSLWDKPRDDERDAERQYDQAYDPYQDYERSERDNYGRLMAGELTYNDYLASSRTGYNDYLRKLGRDETDDFTRQWNENFDAFQKDQDYDAFNERLKTSYVSDMDRQVGQSVTSPQAIEAPVSDAYWGNPTKIAEWHYDDKAEASLGKDGKAILDRMYERLFNDNYGKPVDQWRFGQDMTDATYAADVKALNESVRTYRNSLRQLPANVDPSQAPAVQLDPRVQNASPLAAMQRQNSPDISYGVGKAAFGELGVTQEQFSDLPAIQKTVVLGQAGMLYTNPITGSIQGITRFVSPAIRGMTILPENTRTKIADAIDNAASAVTGAAMGALDYPYRKVMQGAGIAGAYLEGTVQKDIQQGQTAEERLDAQANYAAAAELTGYTAFAGTFSPGQISATQLGEKKSQTVFKNETEVSTTQAYIKAAADAMNDRMDKQLLEKQRNDPAAVLTPDEKSAIRQQVVDEFRQRLGLEGMGRDFALGMVADPLNMLDSGVGASVTAKMADLAGAPNVANAIRATGRVRPFANLEAYKVVTGLSTPIKDMNVVQRFVLGIDAEGKYNLGKPGKMWSPVELTAAAKSIDAVTHSGDFIGTMAAAFESEGNVSGFLDAMDALKKPDTSGKVQHYGEQVIREAGNAFPDLRAQANVLWGSTEAQRSRNALYHAADILGDDVAAVVKNLGDDTKAADAISTLRSRIIEAVNAPDAPGDLKAKAQFLDGLFKADPSGKFLTNAADRMNKGNLAINERDLMIKLVDTANDGIEKWAIDYYKVKPDGPLYSIFQILKGVQSLALLTLSPQYYANNLLNNRITVFFDGVNDMSLKRFREVEAYSGYVSPKVGADVLPTQLGENAPMIDVQTGRMAVLTGKTPGARIREATIRKGIIGTINQWVATPGNKLRSLPGIGNALRNVETDASKVVWAANFDRFYKSMWAPGKGFERSPLFEGRTYADNLYAEIASVKTAAELDGRILGKGEAPKEVDFSTPVNRVMASLPEEDQRALRALGADTMLTQALKDYDGSLDEYGNPNQVERAFSDVSFRLRENVEQAVLDEIGTAYEERLAQIKAEGMAGVLSSWYETQSEKAQFHFQHMDDMDALYKQADTLTGAERAEYVNRSMNESDSRWKVHNADLAANIAAVYDALGADSRQMGLLVDNMMGTYAAWDSFFKARGDIARNIWYAFEGVGSEQTAAKTALRSLFTDERAQRAAAILDDAAITRKDQRNLLHELRKEELSVRYDDAVAFEAEQNALLDPIYVELFADQFINHPGIDGNREAAKKIAAYHRESLRSARQDMAEAIQYFRKGTAVETSNPIITAKVQEIMLRNGIEGGGVESLYGEARSKAWNEFFNIYREMLTQYKDMETSFTSMSPNTPDNLRSQVYDLAQRWHSEGHKLSSAAAQNPALKMLWDEAGILPLAANGQVNPSLFYFVNKYSGADKIPATFEGVNALTPELVRSAIDNWRVINPTTEFNQKAKAFVTDFKNVTAIDTAAVNTAKHDMRRMLEDTFDMKPGEITKHIFVGDTIARMYAEKTGRPLQTWWNAAVGTKIITGEPLIDNARALMLDAVKALEGKAEQGTTRNFFLVQQIAEKHKGGRTTTLDNAKLPQEARLATGETIRNRQPEPGGRPLGTGDTAGSAEPGLQGMGGEQRPAQGGVPAESLPGIEQQAERAGVLPTAETGGAEPAAGTGGIEGARGLVSAQLQSTQLPVGTLARQTADDLPQMQRLMYEIWDAKTAKTLRDAQSAMSRQFREEGAPKPGSFLARVTEGMSEAGAKAIRAELEIYVDKVKKQMAETKLAANRWAVNRRDFSLLDYQKQTFLDRNFATTLLAPYEFWYTRSMWNWGKRLVDNYSAWAKIARLQKLYEETSYDERYPSRLRNKAFVPDVFNVMPDILGDGIYVDNRQFMPWRNFTAPLEELSRDQNLIANNAIGNLERKVEAGTLTEKDARMAIKMRSGELWDNAVDESKKALSMEGSGSTFGLLSDIFRPQLGVQYIAAYARKNNPQIDKAITDMGLNEYFPEAENIGQTPVVRNIQGITALLTDGQGLHAGAVRGIAGLPEIDNATAYMTERFLVELGMQTGDFKGVEKAMVDRSGPLWDKARAMAEDVKGVKTIAGWTGSVIDFLPRAEEEFRSVHPEYQAAREAFENGDTKAMQRFYDEHPVYAAQQLAYEKDPKVRMNIYLDSTIWDLWYGLSDLDRKNIQDNGTLTRFQDFQELFINKETRNTSAVKEALKAQWINELGGIDKVPVGLKESVQGSMLKMMDPAAAKRFQGFKDWQRGFFEKNPGIRDVQDRYFNTESDAESAALEQNYPALADYSRERRDFMIKNPDLIPMMVKEGNKLLGMDEKTRVDYLKFQAEDEKKRAQYGIGQETPRALKKYDKDKSGYYDWKDQYALDHPNIRPYIVTKEVAALPAERQTDYLTMQADYDKQFPGIGKKWDAYYRAKDMGLGARYWREHPELQASMNWTQTNVVMNPDLINLLMSDSKIRSIVAGNNPELQRIIEAQEVNDVLTGASEDLKVSLQAFAYSGRALNLGASKELERLLRDYGNGGTDDEFLRKYRKIVRGVR